MLETLKIVEKWERGMLFFVIKIVYMYKCVCVTFVVKRSERCDRWRKS